MVPNLVGFRQRNSWAMTRSVEAARLRGRMVVATDTRLARGAPGWRPSTTVIDHGTSASLEFVAEFGELAPAGHLAGELPERDLVPVLVQHSAALASHLVRCL